MFEAFAGNKYRSSGIIYWMYNGAWPKLYWQLYDYYFMPNGAFYGAKSACEPLHIQYCYDDKSIKIVNSYYNDFKGLIAIVKIFDFNMKEVSSSMMDAYVNADATEKIFTIEVPENITNIYFLKLELQDGAGKQLSSNFYWLSSKGDEKADFTDLNQLPKTDLDVIYSTVQKDSLKYSFTVTLENSGPDLAFAVNPKILKLTTREPILPVKWEDNYFSLLPGEKRVVKVEFDLKDTTDSRMLLKVDGWNLNTIEMEVK